MGRLRAGQKVSILNVAGCYDFGGSVTEGGVFNCAVCGVVEGGVLYFADCGDFEGVVL